PTVVWVVTPVVMLFGDTWLPELSPKTGPMVSAIYGLSGDSGCFEVNGFQCTPIGIEATSNVPLNEVRVCELTDTPPDPPRPLKAKPIARSSPRYGMFRIPPNMPRSLTPVTMVRVPASTA